MHDIVSLPWEQKNMDGGSKHPRDRAADAKREMESYGPTDPPHLRPPAACHLMCGNEPDGRDRQVAYAGWVQALNEWRWGGVDFS